MEACHSVQPKDTGPVVNPQLVQTSNDGINAPSEISKLPVELLLLIFRHCDSAIRPRLILTHTCHRWRLITINSPPLWTNLRIMTHGVISDACCERFQSLLRLQVDRSGGLPLDIVWDSDFRNGYITSLLVSIQDIAPFSRWRSLCLGVSGHNSAAENIITSTTEFMNLASLVILKCTGVSVAIAFCCATMPKLESFDLSALDNTSMEDWLIHTLSGGALRQRQLSGGGTRALPDSIITLRAAYRCEHTFPSILNYELTRCTFMSKGTIDLRSMTSLTINGRLTLFKECQVVLPSLQHLKFHSMVISSGGTIDTPALHTLHVAATPAIFVQDMQYAVCSMGYRLSPKTSIVLESSLSTRTIVEILTKAPEVKHVTLRFEDWGGEHAVLGRLFGFGTETDLSSAENLCPRLSELRLDLGWGISDRLAGKEWLLDGLKARKEAGITSPLSIYACWNGEGTYVRLMGD